MRVLITGATGLVGKEIVKKCLENDISVHYLTTSKHKLQNQKNYKGFYWNPSKNELDAGCFDGVDAIINLAGATIGSRWTKSNKQAILESRTQSLHVLKEALSKHDHLISHLITASAIGIYKDSLTKYYEEGCNHLSGNFLGMVVKNWEAAADEFMDLGIAVAKVRIGLVLDTNSGALPQMVKPIKYGLGAVFGKGNQWQSWIHIEDLADIFVYILREELHGVYNGVAPNPVTNHELTHSIANVLDRPLWLPNIPKVLMKTILGEMHILLFESQRVSSKKIEERGFEFSFPNLNPALQDLLK
ncbi:TIGR01777 family protein [Mangrovimonas sp. CR14]|uniref:TIGR01777 family oxidoreductase n=1 Tax=Mangrovimonas sp. CR14 TaxID=2706120 RepID=UPI0014229DF1|nr:TIGR01777 family oxidoreductase [Mangrovimonas sp. CR14]NIK92634.1 TIGR01777 family protein [Mangrovimonas sp. CR14]